MTESSRDNGDIYEDLPHFYLDETITKLEESNINLQKKLNALENVIVDLNEEIKALNLKKSALESENVTLSTNISSLYKTAVAEVNRKDNIIHELRRESYARLQNKSPEISSNDNIKNHHQPLFKRDYDRRLYYSSNQTSDIRNRSKSIVGNDGRNSPKSRGRRYSKERRRSRSRSGDRYNSNERKRKDLNRDDANRRSYWKEGSGTRSVLATSESDPSTVTKEKSCCVREPSSQVSISVGENAPPLSNKQFIDSAGFPKEPHTDGSDRLTSAVATDTLFTSKQTPIKKYNPMFNKNLVIVDKSVPNTIYTKRLRKKFLAQIAKENEPASFNKSSMPVCSNNPKLDIKNSSNEIGPQSIHEPPAVDFSKATIRQLDEAASETFDEKGSTLMKEQVPLHVDKLKLTSCISSNAELVAKSPCNTPEIKVAVQESKRIDESEDQISLNVKDTNPSNLVATSEMSSSKNTVESSLLSPGEKVVECMEIDNTPRNSDHNSDVPKPIKTNEGGAVLSSNTLEISGSKLVEESRTPSSFSPNPLFSSPISSSSSNSGSLSASYGHCFKKFKKDGKTRVNPIYIGPRILTKKTKEEKRTANLIRPVSSQLVNLTLRKNLQSPMEISVPIEVDDPKPGESAKIDKTIFSLFGSTPEKCNFVFSPKNSILGLNSDTSLTNFSFLVSDDTPSLENQTPSAAVKLSKSLVQKLSSESGMEAPDTAVITGELEPSSEISKLREEQMASLFGDVSSDSSNDSIENEMGSAKTAMHKSAIPASTVTNVKSSHNNSTLIMQPKVEIIHNFLSKASTPSDSSQSKISNPSISKLSEKTSPNVSSASAERRFFDLSKIPDVCTPFKSTNDLTNIIMCTPAREMLSPIPPTPQGILGHATPDAFLRGKRGNPQSVTEKSEGSELFQIIKPSDPTAVPIIIGLEASCGLKSGVPSGTINTSDVKVVESDFCKKDSTILNPDDGNLTGSTNSPFTDKKVFLSPNSFSAPSVCYTPFKTFSSDSLQSFMHTPSRELLSPIPQTPLGSWDIDNDKTNSCDVILETHPRKNSPSLKEVVHPQDSLPHPSDLDENNQKTCVIKEAATDSSVYSHGEKPATALNSKLREPTEKTSSVITHEINVVTPEKEKTSYGSLNSQLTSSETILKNPKEATLSNSVSISDELVNIRKTPDNFDKTPCQAVSTGSINSVNDVKSLDQSSIVPSTFSPVRTNVFDKNISISSASEQIQFRRTCRKIRKVIISPTTQPTSSDNSSITPQNPKILPKESPFSMLNQPKLKPSITVEGIINTALSSTTMRENINNLPFENNSSAKLSSQNSSKLFKGNGNTALVSTIGEGNEDNFPSKNNSSIKLFSQNSSNLNRCIANPSPKKESKELEVNQRVLSCRQGASFSGTQPHRAVLISTDLANNIVQNLRKNTKPKYRTRAEPVDKTTKDAKRIRSSDDFENCSKKFKSDRNDGGRPSKVETLQKRDSSHNNVKPSRYGNEGRVRYHQRHTEWSSRRPDWHHRLPPPRSYNSRRSRSVSRCRTVASRRSVSRNLGSDYLTRNERISHSKYEGHSRKIPASKTPGHASISARETKKPEKSKRNTATPKNNLSRSSKLLKTAIPETSKLSKDKTAFLETKKLLKDPSENEQQHEKSINSSLSSVTTLNDVPVKNDSHDLIDWKLISLDLSPLANRYESVFRIALNKTVFDPRDPRFAPFLRRSDTSSVDENDGSRATSTPKILKRGLRKVKLGDSSQVFSPIQSNKSESTTDGRKVNVR